MNNRAAGPKLVHIRRVKDAQARLGRELARRPGSLNGLAAEVNRAIQVARAASEAGVHENLVGRLAALIDEGRRVHAGRLKAYKAERSAPEAEAAEPAELPAAVTKASTWRRRLRALAAPFLALALRLRRLRKGVA